MVILKSRVNDCWSVQSVSATENRFYVNIFDLEMIRLIKNVCLFVGVAWLRSVPSWFKECRLFFLDSIRGKEDDEDDDD